MNDPVYERETIRRADDFKALSADELSQVEGGSLLGQIGQVAKAIYDVLKFSGGPVV